MQQEVETHKASSECRLNIKLIANVKSIEIQGEIVNITFVLCKFSKLSNWKNMFD